MGAERGPFHGAGNHQARSVRRGPSAAERKGAEALVALRQGAQVTVGSLSRSRGVLTISCNFGPIQVGSISLSSSVLLNLRPSWLYNQQPKRVTVIPLPDGLQLSLEPKSRETTVLGLGTYRNSSHCGSGRLVSRWCSRSTLLPRRTIGSEDSTSLVTPNDQNIRRVIAPPDARVEASSPRSNGSRPTSTLQLDLPTAPYVVLTLSFKYLASVMSTFFFASPHFCVISVITQRYPVIGNYFVFP